MYLSAKEVREIYKITTQTLYNWRNKGKIQYKVLPSGKIVYLPLEESEIKPARKSVYYARVSNTKQKEDLERQESILKTYMLSKGIIPEEGFTDIASGMNENRKSFLKLMDECLSGKIDKVFITYKDRFTRFGFGYLENILAKFDVEIVVLNATKEEDFQTELTQDLISVIHHFSMKMYSNRRKMLKNLEDEIKKDINT